MNKKKQQKKTTKANKHIVGVYTGIQYFYFIYPIYQNNLIKKNSAGVPNVTKAKYIEEFIFNKYTREEYFNSVNSFWLFGDKYTIDILSYRIQIFLLVLYGMLNFSHLELEIL